MKHWRTYLLFGALCVAAGVIATRLFSLQVVRGDYYRALAEGQHALAPQGESIRGEIYFQDLASKDPSKLFIAARNEDAYTIGVILSEVHDTDVEGFASTLAEILGKDKNEIALKLRDAQGSYALIARGVKEDTATRIKDAALEGIFVRPETVRRYPGGDLAAQALGFLGFQGEKRAGQYGVEGYNDSLLSGSKGFTQNEEGADLELAIDYNIQFIAEQKLRETIQKWDADGGSVIIMDPKRGAIRALANVPSYDPNFYNTVEDPSAFLNSATQALYEPGSVVKPLTMAAAIDTGAVTPNAIYEDTGEISFGTYTIRNFDLKMHGVKTMTEVLELSLNTGAVFAQQRLGKDKFRSYFLDFGLNEASGVDLPAETSGNLGGILTSDRDINFATAAFGQGIAMTPLELLRALAAIANNGVMMKPYVLEAIHYPDGRVVKTEPREAGSPISGQTAAKVTAMLVSVAEKGYDKKVRIPGYTIAAKTGTAQIPNENGAGYSDMRFHSFFGYAPAFNPAFVGLITMKNPKGINFASDSLAPVFRDIASYILQYYQVPPQ